MVLKLFSEGGKEFQSLIMFAAKNCTYMRHMKLVKE